MTENVSRIFNEVCGLFQNNSPFAVYRLPEENNICLIIPESVRTLNSLYDIDENRGFVMAPFDVDGGEHDIIQLCSEKYSTFALGDRDMSDLPVNEGRILKNLGNMLCSRQDYAATFSVFKGAIDKGIFQKLVLARCRSFEMPDIKELILMFLRAVEKYVSSFVYMCFVPGNGIWLGATPEVLIENKGKTWRTVALAGTQPLSDWLEYGVWSEKNIEEQAYVVDFISSLLDKLGLEYTKGDTETVTAGNVVHLRNVFSFNIPDGTLLGSVLEGLHPTPAMCGLPKNKAKSFIIANENLDRKYYSGFAGPVGFNGENNLYVNIRCLHADGGIMNIYAGGGILPESELESEYDETERKMRTLLDIY